MPRRVSVVIPAYDREGTLREALESVLAQGVPDVEVVVVDDGSTDGTAAVAERLAGVRCLRRPHRGPAAARNAGVAAAGGELLAFLDSDDLWAPGKLAAQLALLDAHPEVAMVFGLVDQFVTDGADRITVSGPQPAYLSGLMLARRAAFDEVGTFDETLLLGDFIDWLARAREAGLRSALVPEVLLHRRLHGGNLGRGNASARLDYVRVVKARLERRRAGGG
jgi:glycosyltransferase involved in cell wall biosynthesis